MVLQISNWSDRDRTEQKTNDYSCTELWAVEKQFFKKDCCAADEHTNGEMDEIEFCNLLMTSIPATVGRTAEGLVLYMKVRCAARPHGASDEDSSRQEVFCNTGDPSGVTSTSSLLVFVS